MSRAGSFLPPFDDAAVLRRLVVGHDVAEHAIEHQRQRQHPPGLYIVTADAGQLRLAVAQPLVRLRVVRPGYVTLENQVSDAILDGLDLAAEARRLYLVGPW